jgi:DNA-binding protein H-NS
MLNTIRTLFVAALAARVARLEEILERLPSVAPEP